MALLTDLVTAWRLLWHPRVPVTLKLFLPVLAAAYWVWPIDLLPGMPFDDVAVLLVAARFFVNMAPKDIVNDIRFSRGFGSRNDTKSEWDDGDTVSTTWHVVDDE